MKNIGVKYTNTAKTYMTSLVFQDWILELEKRMKRENRKILLLIDNLSSHNVRHLELEYIRVEMLPPNCTAELQPLDAGIIAAFKRRYKNRYLHYLLEEFEKKKENITYSSPKFSLLQAINFIVKAWNEISVQTIINCFNHTGLFDQDINSNIHFIINDMLN